MSTLLLRLVGPMQSWGTDSRFDIRFTEREPSKSGVIGLVCAALGKPRTEKADDRFPALSELAALAMGVRVDREGAVKVDYQTAGGGLFAGKEYGVRRASGGAGGTVQSWRYYLADADFLVGLSGDETLLRQLVAALRHPQWQLCLGRKAFVPASPVYLADAGPDSLYWPLSLEEALRLYPRQPRHIRGATEELPDSLRLLVEQQPGEAAPLGASIYQRQDVPLDFAARRFGVRFIRGGRCPLPPLAEEVE